MLRPFPKICLPTKLLFGGWSLDWHFVTTTGPLELEALQQGTRFWGKRGNRAVGWGYRFVFSGRRVSESEEDRLRSCEDDDARDLLCMVPIQ